MKKYDVIIIGGGPAGIFAAIHCAKFGLNVAILEKNKTYGRKLLITGGGKCNLTQAQSVESFIYHYGTNSNFVKPCLYAFSNVDFRKFLHKNKLSTIAVDNGKVFPQSLKASDVLTTLMNLCHKYHVKLYTETDVESISKKDDFFEIQTNHDTFYSNYTVISTGGVSFPHTGSTGAGHIFAKKFNHKIRSTKFALAPIWIKNFELAEFSGLSFENLSFTQWRNHKKMGQFSGEVLITHRGISGPAVMNASRYMVKGDIVKLNFIGSSPEADREALIDILSQGQKVLVRTSLSQFKLPKRLMDYFLSVAGIDDQLKCAELKKENRSKLINLLTACEMVVKAVGSETTAMATAGGVSLKEVNPKTMASRIVENLYFAGEVLDVDGDTGGYNIQFAVSSGFLAGESIAKKEGKC